MDSYKAIATGVLPTYESCFLPIHFLDIYAQVGPIFLPVFSDVVISKLCNQDILIQTLKFVAVSDGVPSWLEIG